LRSHLLAKITFGTTVPTPSGEVDITNGDGFVVEDPLGRILSKGDLQMETEIFYLTLVTQVVESGPPTTAKVGNH
jgi:hypothetical protein